MKFPVNAEVISENDTEKIAEEFSRELKKGDIVLLNGDLGTGKTYFVKAVCALFGIKNVSSPSFTIVNEYKGQLEIFHFDFYRIKKYGELYDLGIEDYFTEDHITFVEWAGLFSDVIPAKCYEVKISFIDTTKRKIIITKHE